MTAPGSPLCSLPPELLRKVGDALISIREWTTDQRVDYIGFRTLPVLARTSQFLREPALDALWDTLPNYGFLVYALPQDAWEVDIVDDKFKSDEVFRYVVR